MSMKTTAEDVLKGSQFRKSFLDRLDREPVFESARAILDKAKSKAPEEASQQPPSVIQRNREAFAELKASLASIRSKNNSFFNDTLPSTLGESTVRVLAAADCVNENIPVPNPPTSITGNVRPHNPESFKMAREIFLKGTEDTIKNNLGVEGEEVTYGVQFRIKLNPASSPEDVEKSIAAVKQMMPPKIKTSTSIKVGEDGYLTITAANYNASKDPLEKLVRGVAAVTTKTRGGSPGSFAANTTAPDVFRLATIRVDIPHDLGEWVNEKNEASWSTLTEGVRVAFEAITRDASSQYAIADLAKSTLNNGSYNAKKIKRTLGMLAGMHSIQENSLEVKVAPVELLYALGVETAALPNRLAFLADLSDNASHKDFAKGTKDGDMLAEYLESDALEKQIATAIASKLKLGGTSSRLNFFLRYVLGMTMLQKGEKMGPIIDSILLPIKNIIEEIDSVSFISKSGSAELKIKGINSSLWKWVPNTLQEILDMYRPYGLASLEDIEFNEDGSKMLGRVGDDETKELELEEVTLAKGRLEPQKFFVGPIIDHLKKTVETVWLRKAGGAPPRDVTRDPVVIVEKSKKKNSHTENPHATPSSAWDFASIPFEVVDTEKALEEGANALRLTQLSQMLKQGPRGLMRAQEAVKKHAAEDAMARPIPKGLFPDASIEREIRSGFKHFDEDGSGYLERAEAMSAFLVLYPDASASELLEKIRAADVNGDGKLDFVEFAKIAVECIKQKMAEREAAKRDA